MKKAIVLAAALAFTVGSAACSSRPKRTEAPQEQSASNAVTPLPTEETPNGTVSGSPALEAQPESLGAPSSGRGH